MPQQSANIGINGVALLRQRIMYLTRIAARYRRAASFYQAASNSAASMPTNLISRRAPPGIISREAGISSSAISPLAWLTRPVVRDITHHPLTNVKFVEAAAGNPQRYHRQIRIDANPATL